MVLTKLNLQYFVLKFTHHTYLPIMFKRAFTSQFNIYRENRQKAESNDIFLCVNKVTLHVTYEWSEESLEHRFVNLLCHASFAWS